MDRPSKLLQSFDFTIDLTCSWYCIRQIKFFFFFGQFLQEECLTRQLPEELLDEELYEEDPKISEMVDRYNTLTSTLSDNTAKAETLCSCWEKLDNDVAQLTSAIK